MAVKLTEKKLVTSMTADQTFVVEVGGALRRLKLGDLQKMVGNELFYPTITLEQSSNPQFDLPTPFMANMYRQQMGGYMMKTVGGVVYAAKLDASNWDYFADGSKVDDAAKYETMVRVPDCHFKAEGKTMQFGGLFPIAGGHKFDSPNWVGAYEMFVDSSGVGHSRPGVAPSYSRTMTEFWNCAQKLGSNFGLANYGFQCLIEALYQVSFGNLNSQAVIGSGFQSSSWEACRDVPMGQCISLGDGSGKVLYNDATLGNQYPVKLFGFEDLWGKLWEFRPGIRFYMDGDTRYAVVYSGNQVSNTANGRKFTVPSSAGGEYITRKTLGEYWDAFPQAVGGGDTTYYCDGFWAATSGELLRVGGGANYGSLCGLSSARSYDGFSDSWTSFGARLAFYGNPTIVSGSEIMAM
ncbi:MAG: hypothetical protein MR898_02935 [Prevotella sp.]|nr:hypothetical protein [Prevotella sp.]